MPTYSCRVPLMNTHLRRWVNFLATAMLSHSAPGAGSSSVSAMAVATQPHHNVLLSSAYLMPVGGKLITAHRTRRKVLDLLEETNARRRNAAERAMIVDISATVWNWDTYAIVAGKPSPVRLVLSSLERLRELVPLDDDNVTREGLLVPQPEGTLVWLPKNATLRETRALNGADNKPPAYEFVFEAPIDPNDDRLEHWEQEIRQDHLRKWRAALVRDSLRSMLRFYDLDRVVCWDLSWGIWEASREGPELPSDDGDDATAAVYDCARPVTPALLKETLEGVAGYYLVGGNTYTMSLFHHMWDQQENGAHMRLLRQKLADGTLFYMGHSAVSTPCSLL